MHLIYKIKIKFCFNISDALYKNIIYANILNKKIGSLKRINFIKLTYI